MGLLDGKVAIITGASRGIGKEIARSFVEQGATVAFTYLSSDEKAKALEAELSANGGTIKGFKSNASDFESAQSLADEVMKEFGKIDVLVNNAGITRDNLLMRMGEEDWDNVINTNMKSAFNLTKAVLRPMLKSASGLYYQYEFSSWCIQEMQDRQIMLPQKPGMIGFTKSVAQELGSRSIRCNAIAPGFIETEMTAALDEKVVQGWRDGHSV